MSDIMELIKKIMKSSREFAKYGDNEDFVTSKQLMSRLESRISAMQEVVDAAILYNNGVMEICEFSNVVDGYTEAIKE